MSLGRLDILLGLQWGDEGKGKVVDILAARYPAVARFQGGPNAGHSIEIKGARHVLHTVPSGIFREGVYNLIGNGVVIDPLVLFEEIRGIENSGIQVRQSLRISKRANLILPTHRLLDAANEAALGKAKIGSTGRGIGPTYADKISRRGLRVGDLLRPDFKRLYETLRDAHLRQLEGTRFTLDASLEAEWLTAASELAKLTLVDSELELSALLEEGKSVLAEGAQGSMLDVDFGSYPYVTSSSTVAAGACIGLGVPPARVGTVYGIFKAYCTRVGEGPFPTELSDNAGEEMCSRGHEFGATTGRKRRCGWLDLVALKYAIGLSGVSELIMMKADVLAGFETVRVAVGYRMGGQEHRTMPYDLLSSTVEPIYEDLPGWSGDITGCTSFTELPQTLREYIAYIERATGVRIGIVSVGPGREQTLFRE